VYQGYHRATRALVAVKIMDRAKLNQDGAREISILQRMHHPNIVRLLATEQKLKKMYLVMEFCGGGDLSVLIRDHGPLPEPLVQHYMVQLTAGMRYLADHLIVHRDLKPQNLLLCGEGKAQLKIADFGLARQLSGAAALAGTLCGSPLYMAPEILRGEEYGAKASQPARPPSNRPASQPPAMRPAGWRGPRRAAAPTRSPRRARGQQPSSCRCALALWAVLLLSEAGPPPAPPPPFHPPPRQADLWSIGAILFEMLTKATPFTGKNHIDLLHHIEHDELRLPPGVELSPACTQVTPSTMTLTPTRTLTLTLTLTRELR
jgi:serine/threonine protein kinase